MKWNFRNIVIAAAVMQLGWFYTADADAEELSSREIATINYIVNKAIEETNGNNTKLTILRLIDQSFPIIMTQTPESTALIRSLEEEANRKYSATDEELKIKYQAAAEEHYPTFKTGQTVTVVYLLYSKPFTVSGPFYRQDDKFVWVGSKKIPKSKLHPKYVSCFNPDLAMKHRKNYVAAEIQRYHKAREFYLEILKAKHNDKIFELTGGRQSQETRKAAKKLALEKYRQVMARRREFESALRVADESKSEAVRRMKRLVQVYAGTPEAEKGKKLLAEWEMDVEAQKQNAKQELESVISTFAENKSEAIRRMRRLIQEYAGTSEAEKGKKLLTEWENIMLAEIRELKINDPAASPQLTIIKKINQSNASYLMILPLDRKSEAEQILRKMINIRSNWQEYDRLHQIQNQIYSEWEQMPQDNSISNLRLGLAKLKRANQVGSEMTPWNKMAKKLHQEVDNWIQNEKGRSITVVNGNNNTWILSNVRGPIVLLVWEKVFFGDKFSSYQGWYKVYEPSSPETWNLN